MSSARAILDGASSVAAGTAEEGHEGRVLEAEVHVRQVEEGMAAADGAQQRPRGVAAREQLALAEAHAAAAHRASNTGWLCAW